MSKVFQRQISADSGIEVNKDVSILSAISEGITKKASHRYETAYDEEMMKMNTSPPPNFQVMQNRDVPSQKLPPFDVAVEIKGNTDTSWKKPNRKPLDYVVFAGITSLVMPCLGLPALMFALKSRKEISSGNFVKGWQHSKTAIVLTSVGLMIVALILGVLMAIIIVSDIKMESKQVEAVVQPLESSTIIKSTIQNEDIYVENKFVVKTISKQMVSPSSVVAPKITSTVRTRTTTKGKGMPENLSQLFNSDRHDVYKPRQ